MGSKSSKTEKKQASYPGESSGVGGGALNTRVSDTIKSLFVGSEKAPKARKRVDVSNVQMVFPFMDLPLDLQTEVLTHMNYVDLCRIASTGRSVKDISSSDEVWRHIVVERNGVSEFELQLEKTGKSISMKEFAVRLICVPDSFRFGEWAFLFDSTHLTVMNKADSIGVVLYMPRADTLLLMRTRNGHFEFRDAAGYKPVATSVPAFDLIDPAEVGWDTLPKRSNAEKEDMRYGDWIVSFKDGEALVHCKEGGISVVKFKLRLVAESNGWMDVWDREENNIGTLWSADSMTAWA